MFKHHIKNFFQCKLHIHCKIEVQFGQREMHNCEIKIKLGAI